MDDEEKITSLRTALENLCNAMRWVMLSGEDKHLEKINEAHRAGRKALESTKPG
jgi:hypothetical protein